MRPRIIVRHFGPGHESRWLRLLRVLDYTARLHCPGWTFDAARVDPPPDMSSPLGLQGHVWNTVKLEAWVEAVQSAPDGEQLALFDADLAILQPLDRIWQVAFDLAYTVKPRDARFPLNGGVVFLRVSPLTRTFMRDWRTINRFYLEHPKDFQVWGPHFGGVNQAALGVLMLDYHPHAVATMDGLGIRPPRTYLTPLKLACLEWNCEDEHWARFVPTVTRIVHYKSNLQKALWKSGPTPEGAKPLRLLWHALEKDAMRAEVHA